MKFIWIGNFACYENIFSQYVKYSKNMTKFNCNIYLIKRTHGFLLALLILFVRTVK